MKGFETRDEQQQSKVWVRGVPYDTTDRDWKAKSRAKSAVMLEIEKRCDKETAKAEVILSEIVTDLSCKHGLDENAVKSAPAKEREAMRIAIINSASTALKSLTKSLAISSLRLVTGVIAVLLPLSQAISLQKFCDMLGINRLSKYVKAAIGNREAYNNFLEMSGPILPGEKVICRGGSGVLHETHSNGSLTIKLLPWGTIKKYKTVNAAQMRIRQDIQKTFNEWHDNEFGLVWKMDENDRKESLAKCGMWR